MVKGALGVLATPNAPKSAGHGAAPGHHAGAKDDAAAAPAGAIPVVLGDMWIKSGAPTAKAGMISFTASNEGTTAHGLAVVEAPAKVDGGMVDESTLLGKGAELGGGESEVVSVDLAPGGYELICYLPGHYAAGQKTAFTVQ